MRGWCEARLQVVPRPKVITDHEFWYPYQWLYPELYPEDEQTRHTFSNQ